MRILHISDFGRRATGIGTVIERLLTEQTSLGHEVRIVNVTENIAYKHLDIMTCYEKADLENFIREWRPDAVLFHSIWIMPYIGFARVLKTNDIPYAIMMHGADSKENRKRSTIKKWGANVLMFNRFMKNASAVIYLSKTEEELCLSAKNNKNNVIIPNGCDEGEFNIDSIGIHTPVNIVYLGRIDKFHKGVDVLLDALGILKAQKFYEARVSFYANENDVDLQYLKDRLPELDGIAAYRGGVYGEDKCKVLREADAFVLTSRFEGMPMGVLEAISYGVPCILTPGTNMADDLRYVGAGWKAEFDAHSVAEKIKEAVADLNNHYCMHHEAAYNLSANYNWKRIAQMHIDLMNRISEKQ